ncbi:hypothetical protein Tco_0579857, partial [Tanacetum coccineum]
MRLQGDLVKLPVPSETVRLLMTPGQGLSSAELHHPSGLLPDVFGLSPETVPAQLLRSHQQDWLLD